MTPCANPRFVQPLSDGLGWLSLPAADAAGLAPLAALPRSLKVIAEDMLWRLPEDQAATALTALSERRPEAMLSLAPGRALMM